MNTRNLARRLVLLGAASLALPATAQAQSTDYEAIVRTMRECARISDVAARVACYDSTVRAERLIADADAAAPSPPKAAAVNPPPPAVQRPAPSAASPGRSAQGPARPATPQAPSPQIPRFGAESLPAVPRAPDQTASPSEVELAVRQAERVEPGLYLLTLEDGSQWRFVEAVPPSYDPPRAGSHVALQRAALGSFRMNFASQRAVRIRRVR